MIVKTQDGRLVEATVTHRRTIFMDGRELTDYDCGQERVRLVEGSFTELLAIFDPDDPLMSLADEPLINRAFQAWLESNFIRGAWTWEGQQRDTDEPALQLAKALDQLLPILAKIRPGRARLLGDLVTALVLGGAHLRAFVVAAGGEP